MKKPEKLRCMRCGKKNTDGMTNTLSVRVAGESSPTYRLCDECRTFVMEKFQALDRARLRALMADVDLLVHGKLK